MSGECSLDIFVDGNLIEIYINYGEYVISQVVYGLSDKIEGNIDIEKIECFCHNPG